MSGNPNNQKVDKNPAWNSQPLPLPPTSPTKKQPWILGMKLEQCSFLFVLLIEITSLIIYV